MAFFRSLIVIAGTLATVTVSAAQLYWIDTGGIHRANLDGSAQQLVVPASGGFIWSIAADTSNNQLYWIDGDNPAQIRRSNLDSTNPQDFLTIDHASGGIYVHPVTHDVWWGGSLGVDHNSVFYTSASGLTTTMAFKPQGGPDGDVNDFFIDGSAGKLYNLDTDDNVIHRVNLDGTGSEFLGPANVMAVVLSEGKIYHGNHRENLDGSGDETLFEPSVPASDRAYAVDPLTSTIFFGNGLGTIYRMNTDGSNLQPIITGQIQ